MDFADLVVRRASNDFYRIGLNNSGYRPNVTFTGDISSFNGWFRSNSAPVSGLPSTTYNHLPGDLSAKNYNPGTVAQEFAKIYKGMTIEFPNLKEITVAQWMLESTNNLNSGLAIKANNFGGMKYRAWQAAFGAVPFDMRAQSEGGRNATWAKFPNIESFIRAYWALMDKPTYVSLGWRKATNDPVAFITAIAPKYAVDKSYITKVLSKLPAAKKLLASVK